MNLRCASKALNWSRIVKIILMTWNKFPFSNKNLRLFLPIWDQFIPLRTSHCCYNSLSARGRVYGIQNMQFAMHTHKNELSMLLYCFKVVRNFFSELSKGIFLWVITTTLLQLMPKSWIKKLSNHCLACCCQLCDIITKHCTNMTCSGTLNFSFKRL